jgi:hypothetical protein
MDDDDRFRSRKWILHKNTAIFVAVVATCLIACSLFGVENAPDVSFTLKWAATTMGVVLAAYSTANVATKKVIGDDS